jgi:hypothetical protein
MHTINYEPEDWTERAMLSVLAESDEPVTTSELKQELGVDSTNPFTYRARERLEPKGIITISQGDSTHPTAIAPLQFTLTDDGQEWVTTMDLEVFDDGTVTERIERLENTVERQEELMNKLLLATGIQQDSPLPSLVEVRAGYPAVKSAFDTLDVDVLQHTGKWASDEARDIQQRLD